MRVCYDGSYVSGDWGRTFNISSILWMIAGAEARKSHPWFRRLGDSGKWKLNTHSLCHTQQYCSDDEDRPQDITEFPFDIDTRRTERTKHKQESLGNRETTSLKTDQSTYSGRVTWYGPMNAGVDNACSRAARFRAFFR